jgi:hypothetical protein
VKTLTGSELRAEIEAEAKREGISNAEAIRRRVERGDPLTMWDVTHDLIEKLERENTDTSERNVAGNTKYYLGKWGFGRNKRRP